MPFGPPLPRSNGRRHRHRRAAAAATEAAEAAPLRDKDLPVDPPRDGRLPRGPGRLHHRPARSFACPGRTRAKVLAPSRNASPRRSRLASPAETERSNRPRCCRARRSGAPACHIAASHRNGSPRIERMVEAGYPHHDAKAPATPDNGGDLDRASRAGRPRSADHAALETHDGNVAARPSERPRIPGVEGALASTRIRSRGRCLYPDGLRLITAG